MVVSGNWVPEGEELSVKRFDPEAIKAYHGVLGTRPLDDGAIARAVKVQLEYPALLSQEYRRLYRQKRFPILKLAVNLTATLFLRFTLVFPDPQLPAVDHLGLRRGGLRRGRPS